MGRKQTILTTMGNLYPFPSQSYSPLFQYNFSLHTQRFNLRSDCNPEMTLPLHQTAVHFKSVCNPLSTSIELSGFDPMTY